LNSLELREYNLRVIVLISLLSSPVKVYLGGSPKIKDSIEEPFK
jgi:hypothetical protein